MLDENDGRAEVVTHLLQHRAERLDLALGDARGRLVHEHDVGAKGDDAPELGHPSDAGRELGDVPAGEVAQSEQVDELRGAHVLPALGGARRW